MISRKRLVCEQALGLGIWFFLSGWVAKRERKEEKQTPSSGACSQADHLGFVVSVVAYVMFNRH